MPRNRRDPDNEVVARSSSEQEEFVRYVVRSTANGSFNPPFPARTRSSSRQQRRTPQVVFTTETVEDDRPSPMLEGLAEATAPTTRTTTPITEQQIEEIVGLMTRMEQEERNEMRREQRSTRTSPTSEMSLGYEPPRPRRNSNYLNLPDVRLEPWGEDMSEVWRAYESQLRNRVNWIFNRYEPENGGFTRHLRTGSGAERVPPFSLDDLLRKISKPHPMDTEESKFYDWKFGRCDFILRIEYFTKQFTQDANSDVDYERTRHYIRTWYIHRPTGKTFGCAVRLWNGREFHQRQDYFAEE